MSAILATKLHIPPLRSNLVPRPRLIARLNAGREGRLTLVSAPAGYGKTTLVVEWLCALVPGVTPTGSGGELRVAWLSLDEHDNDPTRFLNHLITSLRQLDQHLGETALSMLKAPQPPPPEAVITALINDIALIPTPFLFVLDDYHLIQLVDIHTQLGFLVEHQPSQMHLVITTREDPPLPLARLRARGQMTEIRQEDLRFSLEECTEFLQQAMGLRLSPTDIAALERRTEGWIAGLQLAALSMQGRADLAGFVEAFTGSSHFVLDYLIEEVFKQQPADVQDFLLRTSILDRLSGPLCDAVASRTGSRSLLERLEHANLFILPLDPSRTWYRYHRLFAELLRQRLHATETLSEKELHLLACGWFTAEGLIPEAIQHALAAPDWERAAGMIAASSVGLLGQGEVITLLGWFKALPDEVVRRHPQLCRDYGWVLTLVGQLDAAAPYLDCAEQALQGDDELLGQVLVAQAYLARSRGAYPQAIELSKRALALISESDILSRGLVTFTLGFSLLNAGHMAEAEPVLLEACQATRSSGNDFARLTILGLLGAIQSNQGRLHRAAEFYRQALEEAHDSPTAAQVHVFLAIILYEWNDLEAAADQLVQALKASRYIGNRAIELDTYSAMVHLKLARGDASGALETLGEIRQLAQERDFPLSRAITSTLHAEIAIAQGDIPSAIHWAQQMTEGVNPTAFGLHLQVGLTQSKLLLAQGKKTEAGGILAGIYEEVSRAGLVSVMIKVRLLQALAANAPVDALHFLEEALDMAQPGGYIRTFLDQGEPVKALLERLKSQGGERKAYILSLLSAFGERHPASRSQPLVEPLSERELDVLRLMEKGLSNGEIAQRLVVSVGTVKSHVHSIINKIGVSSRTQAVARARELELL